MASHSVAGATQIAHTDTAPHRPDTSKRVSPEALCHVVLRTTPENFDGMIDFYLMALGGTISHESHRLCFMTYDHEHHRIAMIKDPTACAKPASGLQAGLHHMAFGFPTLQDLVQSYEEKKSAGIMPTWCVNHGISTSMYYDDPDGNGLEFQVDNFDTVPEAIAFMASPAFAENPVGVDFDPEEFVKRVRSGEDERRIKERPNIGPRDRK
ncbi:Mss4-like protein [Purpureocillium lavendulum]|uniref:Mss4-like protein n=1 Tax=Purpureocillium lavendulum TaxID=1247861 RepID=A0AB34FZG8_9HYPO|nr:Mss4-like protein [Purpureocillium lavendulum]